MPIDAKTHLYGIFGNPVGHSLSPLIHNAAFRHFGINAVYTGFPIEPDYLGIAFEGMRALGIRGVNVTIPFKEEALDFVDEVPEDIDRCIGAVNTVVNHNGRLTAYNTDGPGFLQALDDDLGFKPEGKSILLLGAGGAARGAAFALARSRAEKVWIYNRSQDRAEGLVSHAAGFFLETEFEAAHQVHQLKGEKIDLVVNATSAGMGKNEDVPFDLRLLEAKTSVYDLVYSPADTPFLKAARSLGLPCAGGLGMLVNQAAISFRIWTGKTDGVREVMRAALREHGL